MTYKTSRTPQEAAESFLKAETGKFSDIPDDAEVTIDIFDRDEFEKALSDAVNKELKKAFVLKFEG